MRKVGGLIHPRRLIESKFNENSTQTSPRIRKDGMKGGHSCQNFVSPQLKHNCKVLRNPTAR